LVYDNTTTPALIGLTIGRGVEVIAMLTYACRVCSLNLLDHHPVLRRGMPKNHEPRPRKLRGDVLASNSINPFAFTAEHLSAISIWPKTGNSDVSGCVHRLGQYQRGVVRCNIKISEGLDRHFRFQLITLTPLRLANVGVLTYTVGDSSGTLIMWCVCDYGCLELGLHRDAMSDSNR
jgi:hypothetical protein